MCTTAKLKMIKYVNAHSPVYTLFNRSSLNHALHAPVKPGEPIGKCTEQLRIASYSAFVQCHINQLQYIDGKDI